MLAFEVWSKQLIEVMHRDAVAATIEARKKLAGAQALERKMKRALTCDHKWFAKTAGSELNIDKCRKCGVEVAS